LQEEELIERIAGMVADRLGSSPNPQAHGEKRYIREKEAAAFLGVSVATLRSWRSRGGLVAQRTLSDFVRRVRKILHT
jgi:predicted HD phosphohydrolase